MAKQVTRTVKTFTIHASTVSSKNGKISTSPLAPFTVSDETVTEENAVKFVQKQYGKKQQYVVTEIETEETTYSVPFDVFMANAKVLEKAVPTEQAETATTAETVFPPSAE